MNKSRDQGEAASSESTSSSADGTVAPATSGPPSLEKTDVEVVSEANLDVDLGEPDYVARGAERRAWTQELVRTQLAVLFTLIFIGTVTYASWAATTSHWQNAKDLIQILLPVETALIGSATGFYFATRHKSD